ncbi:hypothetical protein MP228_008464 [Amoeboaphelidium protococcarum]|nr:hypothetical protein MP228_008464 [Amoeboaphelidium protococcarum]
MEQHIIWISGLYSLFAFLFAYKLCGNKNVWQSFIKCGMFGTDVHKKDRPVIAESIGVLCGLAYLVTLFLFIPIPFMRWFMDENVSLFIQLSHSRNKVINYADFPFDTFTALLSGLLSLSCMLLLGFADDVLELKWKFKLILPTIASIPILAVYFTTYGVTNIVVPLPLRDLVGYKYLDLGVLYYSYMGMLAVFCTNSINIVAGINGVETGQTLVITLSLILNDLLYILPSLQSLNIVDTASNTVAAFKTHLYSFYMLLPLFAVTLALHMWNRYPSRVFVGDCFCYFAGMSFASVGILGRMSKTVLLFFIPQIINFVYSCPQLFKLVPCPRHRMPRYDNERDVLLPSMVDITEIRKCSTPKDSLAWLIVYVFYSTGIIGAYTSDSNDHNVVNDDHQLQDATSQKSLNKRKRKTSERQKLASQEDSTELEKKLTDLQFKRCKLSQATHVSNFTLINLILVWFGPMHEATTTNCVMAVQVAFSIIAFSIRYGLVLYFYPE